MIIETLQKEDLESYKALMDESFGGSNSLEVYQQKYQVDGPYNILVAKEGKRIIGSITFYRIDLFTYSFQPAFEIFNVAVLNEYRGQKIAKQLFTNIIDYAKDHGYKSIFLTCLDTATAAHRLYESVGFKKTSSVKYSLIL